MIYRVTHSKIRYGEIQDSVVYQGASWLRAQVMMYFTFARAGSLDAVYLDTATPKC